MQLGKTRSLVLHRNAPRGAGRGGGAAHRVARATARSGFRRRSGATRSRTRHGCSRRRSGSSSRPASRTSTRATRRRPRPRRRRSRSSRAGVSCSGSASRTGRWSKAVRGHVYQSPVATMRAYLDAHGQGAVRRGAAGRDAADGARRARPADAEARGDAHAGRAPVLHHARAHRHGAQADGPRRVAVRGAEGDARDRRDARRASSRGSPPASTSGSRTTATTGSGSASATPTSTNGGSDRFIDATVAWGDVSVLRKRVQAHLDAGASHVCIQPINPSGQPVPDWRVLEALAPGRAG